MAEIIIIIIIIIIMSVFLCDTCSIALNGGKCNFQIQIASSIFNLYLSVAARAVA